MLCSIARAISLCTVRVKPLHVAAEAGAECQSWHQMGPMRDCACAVHMVCSWWHLLVASPCSATCSALQCGQQGLQMKHSLTYGSAVKTGV
jgi:hypothetical protein